MAFTDHKITAFTHKISDLADQPNLPPDELKARFDSSPEELRQAHNALCDDADRLDERVTGIVAATFGDTITEDMLSDELRETIEDAAAGSAVAAQIEAETTARKAADDAIGERISSVERIVLQKTQIKVAGYIGDGADSCEFQLGFQPKAVIIVQLSSYMRVGDIVVGGMMISGNPIHSGSNVGAEITSNGFRVYQRPTQNVQLNTKDVCYYYLALR